MLDFVKEDIDNRRDSIKIQKLKEWFAHNNLEADNFKKLIADLNLSHADFQAYSHFNPDHYTRNVIVKSERVEVLLICWEVGQMSPVHNHGHSQCFVHCLEGSVVENSYLYKNNDMQFQANKTVVCGESTLINHPDVFHEFGNASAVDRAVTLHIYSPKINCYNLFDKVTRTIEQSDF
jgi:cysteine dioxygenase